MKQHWQQVLIRPEATLRATIEVIDRAALQIALVVDDQEKLLGVVTDGDIRRALIRGLSLEHPVFEVMNKRPKVAALNDSKTQLIAMMEGHHLYQLPVVDEQGRVVRLESLQALYKQPAFPNPVFLMAGGFGTRLRPYTDECPKPLLEIGGKPILETIIENFVKSGFRQFYIAVHYRAQQIKDYFGDGGRWGIKIDYIDETEPMGTAGAIGLMPDNLPDVPLIVMNGDILTQIDFSRLLAYHNEQQAIATLCVRQYEYQIPYGVVRLEQQRVVGIEEKPLQSCLANAGIYVLDHSLINSISAQKKLDMPTLLNQQVAAGEIVSMFPVNDYWLDIGREADFLRAQGEFAKYF
ncbi:CBS domain-containing protein [Methylomonas sp. LW13]|uniref:Nucleotidyltransferase family protein n=1 Tax=Methylomonas defluvii TaxID=3045149 RepID=A0ABU4U9P7_9GAMM|nr:MULTISPECIES: nucleotidyltransferase family protein [unclassified Methylomonas]MDX8126169.1 nucleotidyltransferase family protein [Methylomonas sp. OY6]NOV31072.1 CBS domain-containing protein [Methylomonas sp. ZR1]PKD41766.1 alcohol dehydrogenase [Methylomonas sp. Kb3]QBC26254.1 CBS domain-containing protein [Methylomonas sp. LW13]